ncbi:hypothetical protein QDQ80_15010 [Providencia rettgeri]|uniref:hypothetical protein n=1 Tax=Providencia rettgeri TaxID=587 RepID=UPI00244C690B|nr:hypothetical protein [Providencia rettgeri]MDH2323594.1 hypothetical protein [Providencia rettgeri]
MDSKRISALNERLINIKNKIKDINGLLMRYKNSIDEMSNNMELVKIQLEQSEHPNRVKMNKIMDEVKQKIKVRDKEQRDELKSLGEFFNKKEKNIKTFIKSTSTYKAVNFVNVGGLKRRIFDFIAVVNRDSELVEKELSSLQIELNEVSTKYPGIKGDWLEALLKPDALIGTAKPDALIGTAKPDALIGTAKPDALIGTAKPNTLTGTAKPNALIGTAKPNTLTGTVKPNALIGTAKPNTLIGTAKPDALIEMTAALEPSQEMTSSVEALVETQHKPLVFVAKHSCFGKTAWCGITH